MRSGIVRTCVMCAVVAAVLAVGFTAYAKRKAEYAGTETCIMCHEGSHGSVVAAYMKTAHHHAMADVAEQPEALVGKFDDDAPFKKEDVKYVLGRGKVYQNYLDKDLKLLPGKWDVKEQKWIEIESADGRTQCVGCHVTNFDPESKEWTELGVGCEGCHGPGADHAESMDAADIVKLGDLDQKKRDMVCGQCHAVGTDLSGKYAFSPTFVPGDDLDKHFTLKTPGEGAANSQYNDFIHSTHAEGGMLCTTCHDTHGDKAKAEHQLKKPVNDLCLACHKSTVGTMKEHAPDSQPDDTCATCHMLKASHSFEKTSPK